MKYTIFAFVLIVVSDVFAEQCHRNAARHTTADAIVSDFGLSATTLASCKTICSTSMNRWLPRQDGNGFNAMQLRGEVTTSNIVDTLRSPDADVDSRRFGYIRSVECANLTGVITPVGALEAESTDASCR